MPVNRSKAHFKEDELFRTVYERGEWPDDNDEPDCEFLDQYYSGHIAHYFMKPHMALIQPFSSMMYAVEMRVDQIIVAHTEPRDVDTDDPLECYDEPPTQCD